MKQPQTYSDMTRFQLRRENVRLRIIILFLHIKNFSIRCRTFKMKCVFFLRGWYWFGYYWLLNGGVLDGCRPPEWPQMDGCVDIEDGEQK